MFGIGASEIALILIVALIFIGPSKLPEVARTVGKTYREFLRAMEDVKKDFNGTGDTLHHDLQSSFADVKKDINDTGDTLRRDLQAAVAEEHETAKARTAGVQSGTPAAGDIDKPQPKV